jgi:hypothetical protein
MEKGSEEGDEEGMSRGQKASIVRNITTKLDWTEQYIIRMIEQEQRRHAVSTNVSRWHHATKKHD